MSSRIIELAAIKLSQRNGVFQKEDDYIGIFGFQKISSSRMKRSC
ncbi:hypothetical protein NE673_20550 [Blautia producta]|nr:hypothetical protein [Blautia producta]MCQ5096443.1 hypothetical protein [Blautia producta]